MAFRFHFPSNAGHANSLRLRFFAPATSLHPQPMCTTAEPRVENTMLAWDIPPEDKNMHLQKFPLPSKIPIPIGSLDLGHLWETEMIGEPKQWEAQLRKSIKQKDKLCWLAALQDKTKLRTYRILNFRIVLCKEEYLSWDYSVPACVICSHAEWLSPTENREGSMGKGRGGG